MPGYSKPFMAKTFYKEMMQRIRLRNRFLKNPDTENKKYYNKQRNLFVSLVNLFKMGGAKKLPNQFFPCNFYKRRN